MASGAGPIWRRYLVKKENQESLGQIDFAFKVMSITAIFGLFTPFFSPFYIQGNPIYLFLLALLCGMFGAGYFISSYVAQKHVEAGITNLVGSISIPVTILLASLFLHETLGPMQIMGAALLLVAMLIISNKHRPKRFHFDKYFLLMVSGGIS
ncbi:MAG: DMT family transporter, partial [Patescibacteria group bacterium]